MSPIGALVHELGAVATTERAAKDPLTISVVAKRVERHESLTGELDRWAQDEAFWIRRSEPLQGEVSS